MATLGDVLREIFQTQAPADLGYGRVGASGPVPDEQPAMREPFSVPAGDIPSTPPSPVPTPEGADNPMIAAIKKMFAGTPQPADGMDNATYQPGRKMPTGEDFASPTVTVEPPPRAPAPTASAPPPTIDVQPRRTAGVTYGDARIPPGMMPRGPGADIPDLFPPGRSPRGPVPAPAPAADGPNEMARMFRNFFQGAAAVNPTSPKFSAFAQGAAGSMTSNYQEKQAEEQRKAQRERQGFEDSIKIRKAGREDALAESLIGYRKNKAGDPAGVRYQDINAYNQIKNNVERDYKRALDLIGKNYEMTPAEKKKAQEEARGERNQRLQEIEQQYKQRTLSPTMPEKKAGAEKPAATPPSAGEVIERGGTKWKFKGGDPTDKNNWEALR